MKKLVNQVQLRISDVDVNEINSLSASIEALRNPRYQDSVVHRGSGEHEFVVTVKPATLQSLKDALWMVLHIVQPERIAIEP
ncbi:MAG: hypothetical protein D6743_08515 [Calditrichaeota bacterium]|nr:MAG: hypothetical protein D6743_08515 [Calditrichota bacterium]